VTNANFSYSNNGAIIVCSPEHATDLFRRKGKRRSVVFISGVPEEEGVSIKPVSDGTGSDAKDFYPAGQMTRPVRLKALGIKLNLAAVAGWPRPSGT